MNFLVKSAKFILLAGSQVLLITNPKFQLFQEVGHVACDFP